MRKKTLDVLSSTITEICKFIELVNELFKKNKIWNTFGLNVKMINLY